MRKLALLCFVLFLMTLPATVRAQVTYDNSAYGQDCGGGCTTSLTYSLTVGAGSNRALAVWVFISTTGFLAAPEVSSITYAGVSLIPIKISKSNVIGVRLELWALPAGTQPTTGTNNVVVTLNNIGQMNSMHSGAISVAGVDQTQTFASLQSSIGSVQTSVSMTIPYTGANDLVFDAVCAGASVDSTSQTQRFINNVNNSTTCNNSGLATAAGGTTYVTWNVNNAGLDYYGRIGGSFHAAATATKLQLKGGKLQVVAASGTSTPVTPFNYVQSVQDHDCCPSRNTATTAAFPSSTTTGNTIICEVGISATRNLVTSVTESQSDTYQKAVRVDDATNVWGDEIWYASSITG